MNDVGRADSGLDLTMYLEAYLGYCDEDTGETIKQRGISGEFLRSRAMW